MRGGDALAGVGVEAALVADLAVAASSLTASASARPIMWVDRLDVVRVSNGEVSVSGSGTSICPGSHPSIWAAIRRIDCRTSWPISVDAQRTT